MISSFGLIISAGFAGFALPQHGGRRDTELVEVGHDCCFAVTLSAVS
jgi:hypothetical protein